MLDTTDVLILRVLKELQEGAPSLWSFSLDQVAGWAGLSRREVAGHAGVLASQGYVAREQAFGDTPCYRLCDEGRAFVRLGMARQGVGV